MLPVAVVSSPTTKFPIINQNEAIWLCYWKMACSHHRTDQLNIHVLTFQCNCYVCSTWRDNLESCSTAFSTTIVLIDIHREELVWNEILFFFLLITFISIWYLRTFRTPIPCPPMPSLPVMLPGQWFCTYGWWPSRTICYFSVCSTVWRSN